MRILVKVATILFASACLCSCASPVSEQAQTGFISDYSSLEKASDTAYIFSSPKLYGYSKFLIEDPVILFDRNAEYAGGNFTDDELDELVAYYKNRLVDAITKDRGYTIVDEPGKGVARIKVALTAVDATVGILNVSIYTKFTGAGLGGAAMEREITDSLTGEQLASAVQWGNGSRYLRAGFTKLGDAKLQINRWTNELRKSIDEGNRI